jgi:hypothetical protein
LQPRRHASSRSPIDDARLRALLLALDERGVKLTYPALEQRLQLSPIRLRGLVTAARRLLNVDGYVVLSQDDTSQTVALNLDLLRKQFEVV